jgi:hypothetical protein
MHSSFDARTSELSAALGGSPLRERDRASAVRAHRHIRCMPLSGAAPRSDVGFREEATMENQRTEDVAGPDLVSGPTFGPTFFLGQLRAFARERCPSPSEALPSVALHLATGEELELCHVMGLAPAFVALAVVDEAKGGGGTTAAMRTELVPYGLIARVTIRPHREAGAHVGFDPDHAPHVISHAPSPEDTLRAVASTPPALGTSASTRRAGRT